MLKKFKTKKGKEISIRYLCIEDTKDLLKVYNALFEERAYTVATNKFTLKQETLFIQGCLNRIERGQEIKLVVEYNGHVVGISGIEKELSPMEDHRGTFGIMLSKEVRGEGVGEELTKTVIKEAKRFLKIKMVVLYVFEENIPAINLYKKLGFYQFGRLEKGIKYFGKLKTEIFMAKNI